MRRCFRFVLFGFLLLITFTPTIADALPYNSVVYGPLTSTKDGVQTIEVGVVAFGKYDAAMVALGYGSDFIHNLSSDARAKLSNQSTGGDFWSFAQNFTLAPNDDLMSLNGITWKSLNALYGYGNVRRGVYTQGEAANAKRDLLEILNGGSLGGGGTGVGMGFITSYYSSSAPSNIGYVQNGDAKYVSLFPAPDGYTLLSSKINIDDLSIPDAPSGYKNRVVIALARGDWSTNSSTIYVQRVPDTENVVETKRTNSLGDSYILNYQNKTGGTITWYIGSTGVILYYDSGNLKARLYGGFSFETRTANNNEIFGDVWSSYGQLISDADSANTPVVPPSNWPDTPDVPAPTAPEVPTPTEPDLPAQPSTPTAPSLPDFPSNVIVPGTTYETFDIQAILDAMDEHCQHIQSAVYQGFSDYFDTFTPWLRDEFSTLRTFLREEDDWIVESISDEFMELRSYLKELAEWLADQMDFTITGGDYDDSTVVSWLKKIYYKLSGPSVNTKPVDPVGDPDGSWDWLKQLIDAILSALAGGAAALTGTLGELFEGIKDKFPFSIPWDIVAIVALLDAPPVTPSAVIEYDVFGAHVRYDIDLHFFDEQASVIRAMEDVLFCAFLLFKTDWLTGIFDGIGGFLGGKLKSTVKGV